MQLRNMRAGRIIITNASPRPKGERPSSAGNRVILKHGEVGTFDHNAAWTKRKALAVVLKPVDKAGHKWLADLREV